MKGGDITAELVAGLVAAQFPELSALPVEPVPLPGWDNISFRLGDELLVRLPRDDTYAPQVAKEHQWLPFLAPHLPFRIPEPVAIGKKDDRFPRRWSIYRWITGEPAAAAAVTEPVGMASDLAGFLTALRAVEASGGPPAGSHSFYRGGSLEVYDEQTRAAIDVLANGSSAPALMDVWDAALDSTWSEAPVWVHGDITASNLLLVDGALDAVIDFGCAAVGDPACDIVMTWTYFSGEARETFRRNVEVDAGTWARARGWALWKALITLVDDKAGRQAAAVAAARFGWSFGPRQIIDLVAEEHASSIAL